LNGFATLTGRDVDARHARRLYPLARPAPPPVAPSPADEDARVQRPRRVKRRLG
jgi:hypothetical protein